jgi:hypothetical protein
VKDNLSLTRSMLIDKVLLMDEADVFLEERSMADLQRNSLVSGKPPAYQQHIFNNLLTTFRSISSHP